MVVFKKGNDKYRMKPRRNPGRGRGIKDGTYVKFKVTFQCPKEECKHEWVSAHGWREQMLCEFCESKCIITDVKDENMELDNYACPGGHRWQAIHDDTVNQQECEECGEMGTKDGSLMKFGRHFWYECTSKDCGVQWEDFSLKAQRTQRCMRFVPRVPEPEGGDAGMAGFRARCGGRGHIIKAERFLSKRRLNADQNAAGEMQGAEGDSSEERTDASSSGENSLNTCDIEIVGDGSSGVPVSV